MTEYQLGKEFKIWKDGSDMEVYFLITSKKVHLNKNCHTLNRSKNILTANLGNLGNKEICKVCKKDVDFIKTEIILEN